MNRWIGLSVLLLIAPDVRAAEEPNDVPKPVPMTRQQIKEALEALKRREPRLPLPEATADDRGVNNGRMRALHLSKELQGSGDGRGGGFNREPDTAMTLDNTFKVYLFWITSRMNNCHYCLGHQEHKLLTAGVKDDTIAALDGDWSEFTPAERAAFAFTRKLTFEPHRIMDADVAELAKFYKPQQVLEIIYTVAGYNGTNRWTDSLGIPAEKDGSRFGKEDGPKVDLSTFVTPTSDAYRDKPTKIALARDAIGKRGPLEPMDAVEEQLAKARKRTARVPMADEEAVVKLLGEDKLPVTNWVRLLATFPKQGISRARSLTLAREKGALPPNLKAQMEWVAARNDRAWYALGTARKRLRGMGMSDDAIAGLDEGKGLSDGDQAALLFTKKLTISPQAITDADIAKLRKHFTDTQVAEIVYHTTNAAFFDRVTEASNLPLDAE